MQLVPGNCAQSLGVFSPFELNDPCRVGTSAKECRRLWGASRIGPKPREVCQCAFFNPSKVRFSVGEIGCRSENPGGSSLMRRALFSRPTNMSRAARSSLSSIAVSASSGTALRSRVFRKPCVGSWVALDVDEKALSRLWAA